jgi:hypothetical protein
MRQRAALGVGLLTWLLAGCAGGPAAPARSGPARPEAAAAAPARDVVLLEVALLECPLGDPYINRDVWGLADELVVGPEHQAAVEDNGFRVAQIGGIVPDELQELLTSKRSNVNPRRRQILVGHPVPLNLGPTVPVVQYSVVQDGEPVTTSLEQAQCRLLVVPAYDADGKVRLHFTPQVEYGERVTTYHPAPDGSGWVMQVERPEKSYPELNWDVTLAPNQYLVVGARFDQRQSLGYASFVQADPANPVQRLLVIRTRSAGGPGPDDTGDGPVAVYANRSPVLAEQAQLPWTTARGRSP